MNPSSKMFTYTARRAAYFSTIAAFLFLMLAEGSLITYVITLFIHNGWLKLIPVVAIGAWLAYIGVQLFAPLFTKHQLTEADVWLRYGFTFNLRVPLTEIVAAEAAHELLNMLQPTRATYDANKQRIVAAFSNEGQVLLHLRQPNMLKFGRKDVPVQTILLNVDGRDEFLAALNNTPINGASAPGTVKPCHPEHIRSTQCKLREGSVAPGTEMLRCAQHDMGCSG